MIKACYSKTGAWRVISTSNPTENCKSGEQMLELYSKSGAEATFYNNGFRFNLAALVGQGTYCGGISLNPDAHCMIPLTFTAPAGCTPGDTFTAPVQVTGRAANGGLAPPWYIHFEVKATCPSS